MRGHFFVRQLQNVSFPLYHIRWYKHISDLKKNKENGTEISKNIGKLKNNNIYYDIDWEIIHHTGKAENPQSICSTCILEKVAIAKADRRDNLNKR